MTGRADKKLLSNVVFIIVIVVSVQVSLTGFAAEKNSRPVILTVPLMPEAPKLDGKIDRDEWKIAHCFDGFLWGGNMQRRRVRGYVGATEKTIYVAIRSQLPDEGILKAEVKRDSLKAVHDEAVEVFVTPTPLSPDKVCYQKLVNSLGNGGYNIHKLGKAEEQVSWQGNWKDAHGFHDGYWHFECAVPVGSMNTVPEGRATTDGVWQINLARDWKDPWQWSSLAGGYNHSGLLFQFAEQPAPAVQYRVTGGANVPPWTGKLTLHNPSDQTLKCRASLHLDRADMPAMNRQGVLILEPGKRDGLDVKVPASDPTSRYTLHLRVESADQKTVFYSRKITWKRAAKPYRWLAGKAKKKPPVDFRFGYYPYRKKLRLMVDINGMPKEAEVNRVLVVVRERLGGKEIKAVELPAEEFKDGFSRRTIELPELEGFYEIAVRAEGEDVPNSPQVKAFQRKHYPWENTPSGRSTKVYPPFTPIEVDEGKKILKTVLRTHELNDMALWNHVNATAAHTEVSRDILAAPMQCVVRVEGGEEIPARPAGLAFEEVKDHKVIARGGFAAGPLQAEVENVWDYDGCAKIRMTLQPTGGKSIGKLRLEIPFSEETATLVHANADRIRAPVADRIPEGEGVVWDATKVAYNDFPKTFCPYIFVGTPNRGICWFAENDLNWGWNENKPNLDLYREDGAVILRVHLINRPTVIERPRTITFGLLAAPVKPRMREAGTTKHWWRYRYNRDNYTLLGTCINWLSIGCASSVYPAAKDMYLWEMIARGNQERLSREAIQKVIDHGRRYFEKYYGPKNKRRLGTWSRHVSYNLRSRYGEKMIFYYNRASNRTCEEFHTFKDEWCLQDWRSYPDGNNSPGEIKIVPTDSYIDFALYWYARSFEIGSNKGVYWDNFFIASSFNTEMTDAYRLPDGRIRPAAGIWGLRDLARRTFVLLNERNMLPVTFPHMTSFSPLPMMSFCTLQYDWEWKYGRGDTQDRFSRELILLTTNGELAGAWPVLLGGRGKNQVMHKTYAAVRLLHELDGGGGWQPSWNTRTRSIQPLARPFLRLLKDKPEDLEVYRYWDERPQPAVSGDADVPTIVYTVPAEETVIGVVSYAQEDRDVELRINWEKLGLNPSNTRAKRIRIDQLSKEKGKQVCEARPPVLLSINDGKIDFELKKHDIAAIRLIPKG